MIYALVRRAIVLVREDQRSLAIGRRAQNVRLASQLVGRDLEVMTPSEFAELKANAEASFARLEGVDSGLARKLIEQGMYSFRDLSGVAVADLVARIEGLTEAVAARMITQA